jgi:hypothetical protein
MLAIIRFSYFFIFRIMRIKDTLNPVFFLLVDFQNFAIKATVLIV